MTMDDEIKQWQEELKREREELKRQRKETDRVICESREMDAKLMDAWLRLEAQTNEMIKSQAELKQSIRELEEKQADLLSDQWNLVPVIDETEVPRPVDR